MVKTEANVKPNRLFTPQLVGLVSSLGKNGKPNIAAYAWTSSASSDPAMVSIAVSKKGYTNECIRKSREFVLNLPTMDILKEVQIAGSVSGRDTDKFEKTGLTPIDSLALKTPSVAERKSY